MRKLPSSVEENFTLKMLILCENRKLLRRRGPRGQGIYRFTGKRSKFNNIRIHE